MRPGLFAFAAAAAFFGAALYINIVEQPARLTLDVRSMVREWTASDRRSFMMLSALSIISAILARAEYSRTGDMLWSIGGVVILMSLPYAYFVMVGCTPPFRMRGAQRFANLCAHGVCSNGDKRQLASAPVACTPGPCSTPLELEEHSRDEGSVSRAIVRAYVVLPLGDKKRKRSFRRFIPV
jgi:hypothetical protein